MAHTFREDLPNNPGMRKEKKKKSRAEILSCEPRAFMFHNFLSDEECRHLIKLGKPSLKRSVVIDSKTGQTKESSQRTSTGSYLRRGQDPVVQAVEKRIADFTFLPVENGEGLSIIHYEVGQKFDAHVDYFGDELLHIRAGNQRVATVVMYLSEVEVGGETVFPSAKVNLTSPSRTKLPEYVNIGLSVKPKMGDALFFWNIKPDGSPDPLSRHGGCPVIQGNKWVSTKWIRNKKLGV